MKKILVVLSFICFVAVNVTNAQTSAPVAKADQKEAVAGTPTSGCSHATKVCCKKGSSMKTCTPSEKAKCEANKAKADATPAGKAEAKSTDKN